MAIRVNFEDILVTSDHPESSETAARCIAKVLSTNWLIGAPQEEPLIVTMTHQNGDRVPYTAKQNGTNRR